jgi:hypothetical protein
MADGAGAPGIIMAAISGPPAAFAADGAIIA